MQYAEFTTNFKKRLPLFCSLLTTAAFCPREVFCSIKHLKKHAGFRKSNEAKEHSFLKEWVARARAYIPLLQRWEHLQRWSAAPQCNCLSDCNLFAPSKPSAQKHFISHCILSTKHCTQLNWPRNLSNKEVTFSEVMPIREFPKVH